MNISQDSEPLQKLGQEVQKKRKALKIAATSLAEIAQISRITLHRIEKGEATVAMGSYLAVLQALGQTFKITTAQKENSEIDPLLIPAEIKIVDYPGLKSLTWQIRGVKTLTPQEAHGIYSREVRHLDLKSLSPDESRLIAALKLAFDESH